MLLYLYHHDGNDILNCAPSCLTIVVLVAHFSALYLFKKPRVEFFAFSAWFMHCQQVGEVWAWKSLLDTFRRCSYSLGCNLRSWNFSLVTGPTGVDTGLTGVKGTQNGHRPDRCRHRSDRCEQWCSLVCASCFGEFAYVQGELACVQGELFWIIALVVLLLVYRRRGALSCLPCEESVRALLSSDHVSDLCLDFWSLVELVLFGCWFFSFFFIWWLCVVNALIMGEIEDQKRPRTRVVAP